MAMHAVMNDTEIPKSAGMTAVTTEVEAGLMTMLQQSKGAGLALCAAPPQYPAAHAPLKLASAARLLLPAASSHLHCIARFAAAGLNSSSPLQGTGPALVLVPVRFRNKS